VTLKQALVWFAGKAGAIDHVDRDPLMIGTQSTIDTDCELTRGKPQWPGVLD